jgi:tRNA modification GTPase
MTDKSTIFALSSGRLPAAVGVVRVSGPGARDALRLIAGDVPPERTAVLRRLKSAQGDVIDRGLVMWFPARQSATGEDVVEFHIHGSRAVLARMVATLSAIPELRPAERGEFTRRALENGKVDLVSAEALHDLIEAETEAQRRQAQRQLQGLLGPTAENWRKRLIAIAAMVEANLDFSDEGDVADETAARAIPEIETLCEEIEGVLALPSHAERLRDGLVVAIAGPPNVGKSTLLNRLARREAAIVSPHAGTTRDVIEVHLDLHGYPVILLDTAGIRASDDPVEQEGVRRTLARAAEADLVLWLQEVGQPRATSDVLKHGCSRWIVWTKTDLDPLARSSGARMAAATEFRLSATADTGIDGLVEALAGFAQQYFGGAEETMITRARHRRLLDETAQALRRSLQVFENGEELAMEELRTSIHSLGRLVGRIDVEDVLDAIFAEFCIGK